jgi:hypothetical protein
VTRVALYYFNKTFKDFVSIGAGNLSYGPAVDRSKRGVVLAEMTASVDFVCNGK